MVDFQSIDYQNLPLPPPWIELCRDNEGKVELIYINDATGEEYAEHPFIASLRRIQEKQHKPSVSPNSSSQANADGMQNFEMTSSQEAEPEPGQQRGKADHVMTHMIATHFVKSFKNGDNYSLNPMSTDHTSKDETNHKGETNLSLPPVVDHHSEMLKRKKIPFVDFKCLWKETSLMGEINCYGLTIRFFEDQQTMVRIDGIDGQWLFSALEGPHGPLTRYDLFIGAKVTVFGRHLTISSANASVCHWIEVEARKLEKRIAWLQSKIEEGGDTPCVRREPPKTIRHIQRSAQPEGHSNLRKLCIDKSKLQNQLCDMGLGHLLNKK
jgi:hypothetical protein